MKISSPPPQPDEKEWKFTKELRNPEPIVFSWTRQQPRSDEADLRGGICLEWALADDEGLLETARADLLRSLRIAGLSVGGSHVVTLRLEKTLGRETFCISVAKGGSEMRAGDLEGMRRALYCLEEQLRKADGPFLPLGKINRRAVIETRISRCFFGPIKRPPKNRDELMDDEDYYPDEYLSRLAREGVNGLWLTSSFHELCPSRFFPEFGRESERRLKKLRETVERCARYGIGIYLFCIEPQGFGDNVHFLQPLKHLERHPELAGHRDGDFTFFCTSTPTGKAYLEESTRFLFTSVPRLAGLIGIHVGERPTHCYSNLFWDTQANQCPRCSLKEPWEVLREMLSAMKRGMKQASPGAKLISWLYVPTVFEQPERPFEALRSQAVEIAAHFPRDVIFQYNFESMGTTRQLGRERIVRDYSLAHVGPSAVFSDCARAAVAKEITVSAKLQVGCSHEVATVPWVPVPGNLFLKYKAMHRLGVSAAMQCWYFGNYPSPMTRAAGRLSFAPLPRSEHDFLRELAAPEWGEDAPLIAQAWEHFSAAYREFPANVNFAWYGPVHDAVAWPLHLQPVDRGIAPSWRLGFPPSGDRIGECIGSGHRLDEILVLCERMTTRWRQGLEVLKNVSAPRRRQRKLALELGLAQAMGLQLESAWNVMKFYALREQLFTLAPTEKKQRLEYLHELRRLVRLEISHSRRLARLSARDSRLGFHSEAEGYKYFPALLLWRAGELRKLLNNEFGGVERKIRAGQQLFPEYTGARKTGKKYHCPSARLRPDSKQGEPGRAADGQEAPWAPCLSSGGKSPKGWKTQWRAVQAGGSLEFEVTCAVPAKAMAGRTATDVLSSDHVAILIEPRRLWPAREFVVGIAGARYDLAGRNPGESPWTSEVTRSETGWTVRVQVPLTLLDPAHDFVRINVIRKSPETGVLAWVPLHPWPRRLLMEDRNPRDLGWFILHPGTSTRGTIK